ncbi:MAG: pilus assembly protein N-terminal domain-containing protein [Pseudomonadota bacterium]
MSLQKRMFSKIFLCLSLVLCSLSSIASERIFVFNGEIKILEVGAIDRVAVGNSKLISTSMLDNGQLLLLAEGVGETTVHIWYEDGSESNLEISIIPNDAKRIMNEIQTLVDNVGEIEVKIVGERIYLVGSLYKSDLPALDLIKASYKEAIDLTKKIDDPLPPTVIPDDKMVFMNVKFAELRGGLDKNLGVAWDQVIAGPLAGVNYDIVDNENFRATDPNNAPAFASATTIGLQNAGPLGFLGLATQINSAINLLVASRNAVILAEPTLSTRSGGKAEFLAGGEIPVVTSGSLGSTDVEYKEFGIKLDIEPIVGYDNSIVAKITTESSTIDPDRPGGGNTPPGFITRRTSTDIRMNDNETLIMSGLVDRKFSENVRKFPFLGDLPVIGALFRSTLTDNDDNDLVIFVTPTIFDANSDINKSEIQPRQQMIDTYKKNTDQEDLIID